MVDSAAALLETFCVFVSGSYALPLAGGTVLTALHHRRSVQPMPHAPALVLAGPPVHTTLCTASACLCLLLLQVNQTLPYRPADKPVVAAAKDLLSPSPCVAGQLGPTAEPSVCNITGKQATGDLRRRQPVQLVPVTCALLLFSCCHAVCAMGSSDARAHEHSAFGVPSKHPGSSPLCTAPPCPALPACPALRCLAVGDSKCNGQQRPTVVVQPGSSTRIRLINAATLVYLTVCFERHTVTVIALDAAPVKPKSFYECVDVNTGQRWGCMVCYEHRGGMHVMTH